MKTKTIDIPEPFDTTVDSKKLERLKQLFIEEYEKNSDLYDERDLNQIKNSDLDLVRFLIAGEYLEPSRAVEAGLEVMIKALRWRKSINLHDLTEESFPKEFYELAGLFVCGQDRAGFPCIYIRVKTIRKVKILDNHQMKFLAYVVNKLERQCNALQSWTLVFDCNGIGFNNVNLNLIHFLIALLREYFPLTVRYAIVLDVPWILNAIQKFVLSLLPDDNKQLIRFASHKGLRKYISDDNIPMLLGGTCKKDIFEHSPNCKSLEVLANDLYGLTKAETEKVKKPYLNCLKEAELFREQQMMTKIQHIDKIERMNNNNNNKYDAIMGDECMECVEC